MPLTASLPTTSPTPNTDSPSTSTTTDSPPWLLNTTISSATIFVVILLICVFSCALSKCEATLRLYLQAKESEPKLTFELWKERRVRAAKQAAADRAPKKRAGREQEIKKRMAEKPFGLRTAGRPGDRNSRQGLCVLGGVVGLGAGTRGRGEIGRGGVGVGVSVPPPRRASTGGRRRRLRMSRVRWWRILFVRLMNRGDMAPFECGAAVSMSGTLAWGHRGDELPVSATPVLYSWHA